MEDNQILDELKKINENLEVIQYMIAFTYYPHKEYFESLVSGIRKYLKNKTEDITNTSSDKN